MPVSSSDIFNCTKCGECCRGYGGTYITEKDIEAIAAYIGKQPSEILSKYCQMSGSRPVLAQSTNGYCLFWDQICTIHPVKPKMCKAWPFIKSVQIDAANWRIMANSCPGMRTDIPDSLVHECLETELKASE